MALANVLATPKLPESMQGMSPMKAGALTQMTRVPGLMDNISSFQQNRQSPFGRSWNPDELMSAVNPNRYVRYDPSQGRYDPKGTLSGSMQHGANFSPTVSSWYRPEGATSARQVVDTSQPMYSFGMDGERIANAPRYNTVYDIGNDAAYQELMRDLQLAESLGNVGYHREIDTSRRKDNINLANSYGTADLNRNTTMDAFARALASYGVQDMADLGATLGPDGKPVYYNQRTGKALPDDLFNVQSKKTQSGYGLNIDEQGNIVPVFDSTFTATRAKRQKRNAGLLGGLAMIAAPFALPALAGSLGAIGAGAAYGTGAGALTAGVGGGNVLKGGLLGGLTGAIGGAIGPGMKLPGGGVAPQFNVGQSLLGASSSPTAQAAVNAMTKGALSGGIGAGAYGGNIGKGVALGGLSGLGGAVGGSQAGMAGSFLGGQIANRLGQQYIGSPFARRAPQQQAQQVAQSPTQPVNLAQFPPEARARMASVLNATGRSYTT